MNMFKPILVRTLIIFLPLVFLSGCIRLVGSAGYTKYKDEETQTKQVGFDTDKIVHPNQAPGDIQMGDKA